MRWTFLVADQDAEAAEAVAAQLRAIHANATVHCVTSGAEALATIDALGETPSLVLYEFDIPDMSGLSFLGELRSRNRPGTVPVAILSRPMSDQQMMTCYRLGASALLTKPVSARDLRETVRDFAQPATRATGQDRLSA